MRLPLNLLILLAPLVSAAQVPWNPQPKSITIIDCLSNDKDYTSLLVLIQRAKLVPTINRLNGSTLFAPTNDAIARDSFWNAALTDAARDNVHEKLRQELLYHLLNYSVSALPEQQDLQVHKTLHFPRKPLDPPSRDPPPEPPWMPVPGGTLGGEPQRLRLAERDGDVWVGTDAFGRGGAQLVKGQVDAGNGVLLGIGDVLHTPRDLATIVTDQPTLSYLNKLLKPTFLDMLNNTPEYTLFLPVDSAWDSLDHIERLYLESDFAEDDVLRILNMHAVATEGVHWSDSFSPALNLTTVDGSTLEIVVTPDKTLISSAELIGPDNYASNGVLHTVSSLLIPEGALQVTPEKYLILFNCSSFVSLLRSVDLTPLINSTEAKYTILAPSNEALELYSTDDGIPPRGSEELKRMLSYHFIPGKWSPKQLKDKMLLETALHEKGLDGGRQVMEIGVTTDPGKKKERTVRFGGVSVIGDSIEVNNTLIYFVSRPLAPPTDPLATALPTLELTSFLAAVFSTSLAEVLRTSPRKTFLIPENDGFKRLGALVSSHLLSQSPKSDLERVIQHHVLNDVEYAKALANGSQQTFATMEGSDVHIIRPRNNRSSTLVSGSGGWAGMHASATPLNMLTNTGVIHSLSDILLPRSVDLTIGKLVKAAKGSTMAGLVVRAGMEWVLNGTAPPENSTWGSDEGLEGVGWTLLCPTDEAFKGVDLALLFEDKELLMSIVEQHLIPTPPPSSEKGRKFGEGDDDAQFTNRPLPLDDSATYTTLQSKQSAYGDIVFRSASGDGGSGDTGYLVGIKNARGTEGREDWARVLSWGRSTGDPGTGGVIQIDQVLLPYRPSWWAEYGAPLATGAVGILAIGLFFLGVRAIWRRDTAEATYEPVGGFGDDEDS